jgi:hypothetical protein
MQSAECGAVGAGSGGAVEEAELCGSVALQSPDGDGESSFLATKSSCARGELCLSRQSLHLCSATRLLAVILRQPESPTTPSPDCPCCSSHEETVEHYLHFCPAHDAARRQLRATNRLAAHSKSLLTDPDLLPDLFLFIQRSRRFHSVFGDFQPLERPKDK